VGAKASLLASSATSLDSFLGGLPSFQEQLSVSDDADIEQILDAFNCLYSLRSFLGISTDLTFNKFIKDILGNPMAAAEEQRDGARVKQEQEQGQGQEQEQVLLMLGGADESRRSSRLVEAEVDDPLLEVQSQDAAELDRIQLNLLRALLPDLHARFALDEDTEAPAPKKEATSKKVC
jgi:hypothetical protein